MAKVCLDTDILGEYFLNKKEAVETIVALERENDIAVTPFVVFELFCLAENSEKPEENKKIVEELLMRITILEWTMSSCAEAANLYVSLAMQKKKVEIRDLLAGVLAAEKGYALLTNNKEAYHTIPRLKLYK